MQRSQRGGGIGRALLLAALIGLPLAGAARADDATPPMPPACAPHDSAQDQADGQTVDTAIEAFNKGGFSALKAFLPQLQTVLSHAPAAPQKVEYCDGAIVVHTNSMAEYMIYSGLYSRPGGPVQAAGVTSVLWVRWPYERAALMLGSYYVEAGDYQSAAAPLLEGVRIDPTDPLVTSEAAHALTMLHRFDEALAVIDRALSADLFMEAPAKARLLRGRGFALGELGRYDEAEAAYKRSLELEPGNHTAQNELDYIAGQRRGAPKTKAETINSNTGEPVKR
jgi:tetratricopeptide (TPR) repeat protein